MISKGFSNEVFDSQKVFRKLMLSMAYPGTISTTAIDLPCPDRLFRATGALLLTLLDFETPLWADLDPDSQEIRWLHFHTGAELTTEITRAGFTLFTDCEQLLDPGRLNPGTVESPDISTTLIIQTHGVTPGRRLRVTGPGIEAEIFIQIDGIQETFWEKRSIVNQAYPAGIDMIFVHEDRFAAFPRTSEIEVC